MIIGEKLKNINYEIIEIDLQNVKSKIELITKVGQELHFPVVGENSWDSFFDWFRDLHSPFDKFEAVGFVFRNCKNLESEVKEKFIEQMKFVVEEGLAIYDSYERVEVPCYYEIID